MNELLKNIAIDNKEDISQYDAIAGVESFNVVLNSLEELEVAIDAGITMTRSLEKIFGVTEELRTDSPLTDREKRLISLANELVVGRDYSTETIMAGNESLVKTLYEIWAAVQSLLNKLIEMFIKGLKEISISIKRNDRLLSTLKKRFDKQNITSYSCEVTSEAQAHAFLIKGDVPVRSANELSSVVDGMTDYGRVIKQIHVSTSEHRRALIDVLSILGDNINNKLLDEKQIADDRDYIKALKELNDAVINRFNLDPSGDRDSFGQSIMKSAPFLGGGVFIGKEYDDSKTNLGIEVASAVEYSKLTSSLSTKSYVGEIKDVSAQSMLDMLTAAQSLNEVLDTYSFEKDYFKEVDRVIEEFKNKTKSSPDRPSSTAIRPTSVAGAVKDFGTAALKSHADGIRLVNYVIMFCHSGIKSS